jgi:hypothetical protein
MPISLRSSVRFADSDGGHDGYQCLTGRKRGDRGPKRRLADGWRLGLAPRRCG